MARETTILDRFPGAAARFSVCNTAAICDMKNTRINTHYAAQAHMNTHISDTYYAARLWPT